MDNTDLECPYSYKVLLCKFKYTTEYFNSVKKYSQLEMSLSEDNQPKPMLNPNKIALVGKRRKYSNLKFLDPESF